MRLTLNDRYALRTTSTNGKNSLHNSRGISLLLTGFIRSFFGAVRSLLSNYLASCRSDYDENVYLFLPQNNRAAAKLNSNQAEIEGIIMVDEVELFR